MLESIQQLLRPIRKRIQMIAGRCTIGTIDDSAPIQLVQAEILSDDVMDEIPRIQNYGFSGVPMPGAKAAYISPNGNVEEMIIVAVDNEELRPKGLTPGESIHYASPDNYVLCKADKSIEMKASAAKITMDPAGKFKIENDSAELIQELVTLVENLIAAQTTMGAVFDPGTQANLNERLTKITSLKG